MTSNTGVPTATEITLTYDEDGDYWLARDETRGVTAQAAARGAALEALDEAVANATPDDIHVEIDPEDPFFSAPTFSSDRSDVSRHVDEYLAEDTYRDKVTLDDGS